MPSQWEFQIGPSLGIEEGDHLWMVRYLLMRVCESLQVCVSFVINPISGDWNGAGTHTHLSTNTTRAPNGLSTIIKHIEKLDKKHD